MSKLPKISVVVPNYNGGSTIARTLDSLLRQGYPNLEILVIDGGSRDNSVAVIQQYADRLAWWVSEKDRGQSHAINKGLTRTTGDVVNWLCSDDELADGALLAIGKAFAEDPTADAVIGSTRMVFTVENREELQPPLERNLEIIPVNNAFAQPSCYYKRWLLQREGKTDGPIDESYHFTMDLELWASFKARGAKWKIIPDVIGVYYMTGENKTSTGGDKIAAEFERVYQAYFKERIPLTWWHRHFRFPIEKFTKRHPGKVARLAVRPLQIATVLVLGPFYGFNRVKAMNWGWWA